MANPDNRPQLPKNQSAISTNGVVSRDWYRFFLNLLNTVNAGGGGNGTGTVTSVNVSGGTTGLTTSGGPITTNGTITLNGTVNVANGGTGATTAANARTNLSVPSLTGTGASGTWSINVTGTASNVSGVVAIANGGTGLTATPANGEIDIGNGTGFTRTTLTAGSGVSITNGAGSVTISATGSGTVTAVTGTTPISSSGGATPNISLDANYGDTLNPYASKTANYVLAAPNGTAGVPTFRAVVAADIPTLNQNTTGQAGSVANNLTAGTGISYNVGTTYNGSTAITITNSAPDQTVSLTGGTGISTSGTYPNFTITNTSPSLGGDVVGPSSATDNAVARYDATTGKLIQNSLVLIGDTGNVTGVNALTAESLTVNDNATLGFSNTDTLDVRARIISDLEPNANNAKDIGTNGRNWRDGFFGRNLSTVNLEVTGKTSFDGQEGTSGQVLTSAGTGATPTWTTPTTGTVTSVSGTGTVNGISLSGTVTSSGNLTLGGALTGVDLTTQVTGTLPISNGGTGQTTANPAFNALAPTTTKGDLIVSNGTANVRQAVGTDTHVLTADSTTATGVKWAAAAGGLTISNDTTTATNLYPTFAAATSGTMSTIYTGNAKLLYKPSTGELTSPEVVASNGLFVNSQTVSSNYTIPAGSTAISGGPITVASGFAVTVSSGARWVTI
jgi:hypothetical protein